MRVAILRPRDRLEESAFLAREMGMEPVCVPSLDVEVSRDADIDPEGFDSVIFTSMSGVRAALEIAPDPHAFVDSLNGMEVVSIGPRTTMELLDRGIHVDLEPEDYSSVGLVETLRGWAEGRRVLLLRSDHGARVLVTGLEAHGAQVREVVVYRLRPAMEGGEFDGMLRLAERGGIDAFALTSSLTADTLVTLLKERLGEGWRRTLEGRVVAIGEPTRSRLEALGVREVAVSEESTFPSLLRRAREIGRQA